MILFRGWRENDDQTQCTVHLLHFNEKLNDKRGEIGKTDLSQPFLQDLSSLCQPYLVVFGVGHVFGFHLAVLGRLAGKLDEE